MGYRRSPNKYVQVSMHPSEDPGTTLYSPNWCEPTTWYPASTRVVQEQLTNEGANVTYVIPNWTDKMHIVDTYHGKITKEDYLKDADGHSYRVDVTVNDVSKTEQDPHVGTGGDFIVNYDMGRVTFLSSLQGSDVVKMTYHKVDRTAGDGSASLWKVSPSPGKALEIVKVEVQFSADIDIKDSVVFQPRAGGYPYGDALIYKTMWDFYNSANGCFPELPALGGTGWRGVLHKVYSFPWMYQSVTRLDSSVLGEIDIYLQHDEPLGGENATATFYCLSMES